MGFSGKATLLIAAIPGFQPLWVKCWNIQLSPVDHVILALNLTKGSFGYFLNSWGKKKKKREKSLLAQYINQIENQGN